MLNSLSELLEAIQAPWSDLAEFLATLTEDQFAMQDAHGWTISDHLVHLAAWEDSVAGLFQGRPRHEALGVDEAYYLRASFDEINERIRQNKGGLPADQAIAHLRRVHSNLMSHLADMSDSDLEEPVRAFFPSAPRTDERRVAELIYENTGDHFAEHLTWMRALVDGAS